MDINVPASYFENLKRYWRRRKYQRLDNSANNKRLQTARLGSKKRRVWKIRLAPKLRFKIVSPSNFLAKFRGAYVNTMIHLVGDKESGMFGGKRIPKGRPVPLVTASNEVVDGRLVLEIYKRIVSSRELSALLE